MKKLIAILMFAAFTIPFGIQKSAAQEKNKIQVGLLLDTSGSMDGLLEQAKAQLWKIVNELALARYEGDQPTLEIALYEYGNDGLPSSEGYIRMISQLTTDLDKISEDLFSLTTNGGNEYCGHVIQTATNQLNWSKSNEDLKMLYIAGNEGFTQGSVSYEDACKKAIGEGIIVNTIFCGAYQEGVNTKWKHGADLSDGKYMNIDHNQKVAFIASPYDDQIAQLNTQLNQTYIGYGSKGSKMVQRQATEDANAGSFGSGNTANRAVTKSSANYKNAEWDLVDAMDEETVVLEEMEAEELPDEMKDMNTEERKKYVEEKKEEREQIQNAIQELDKKRRVFVAEKRKENADKNTLDAVMIESLREQATKMNYTFEK